MFPQLYFPTGRYLTDTIFSNLGFFTGTSTPEQRQIAYTIAENQVEQHLQAFLQPTVYTGTMTNAWIGKNMHSPMARLIEIPYVVFHEMQSDGSDRLISGTSKIVNPESGIFLIDFSPNDVSTSQYAITGYPVRSAGSIYRVDIVYNSGFQTGTAGIPNIQLALAMAADIVLKTIYDPGANPDPDLMAIKTMQVGQYIQTIVDRFHFDTLFGPSNRAQLIRNLLKPFTIQRSGKLGL